MLAARGVPVAEFNLEETPVTGMLGYLHLSLLVCMCVCTCVSVWVGGCVGFLSEVGVCNVYVAGDELDLGEVHVFHGEMGIGLVALDELDLREGEIFHWRIRAVLVLVGH